MESRILVTVNIKGKEVGLTKTFLKTFTELPTSMPVSAIFADEEGFVYAFEMQLLELWGITDIFKDDLFYTLRNYVSSIDISPVTILTDTDLKN